MSVRPRGGYGSSAMFRPYSGNYAAAPAYDYSSAYYGYGNGYGGMGAMGAAAGGAAGYAGAASYAGGAAGAGTGKTHTSSSDPKAVKSRVFVGNLNTQIASREQLEMLYSKFGTVVGLSLHKGYAFVQFSNESQARNAVSFTDGMTVAGQVLDVNISDEPKDRKAGGAVKPKQSGGGFGGNPLTKRSRYDAGLDELHNDVIEYEGFDDHLKCGHCQSVFKSWKEFKSHRSSPCMQSAKKEDVTMSETNGKADGEPAVISCFICKQEYTACWNLIQHLAEKHNMTVFSG